MTLFVFIPTILCRYKCRFTVGRAHNVNGRGRGCEYIAAGSQPDHKGSRDRRCTCRLSFGCQSDNLLTTGWHAGLFCVYLTAGKKRFLRFSETCDYYNLGLVHIRRLTSKSMEEENPAIEKLLYSLADDCEEFSCGYGKNKDSNSVLYLKQKFWRVYQDAFMRGIKRK